MVSKFSFAHVAPTRPEIFSTFGSSRSFTLTWTQPPGGGTVESYTIEYNSTVRGCNDIPPIQHGISVSGADRAIGITNLEENSDIFGTISAINMIGRTSTLFAGGTLTTGS